MTTNIKPPLEFKHLDPDAQIQILHESFANGKQFSIMRVCKDWYKYVQEGIRRYFLSPLKQFRFCRLHLDFKKELENHLKAPITAHSSFLKKVNCYLNRKGILYLEQFKSEEDEINNGYIDALQKTWGRILLQLPEDCNAPGADASPNAIRKWLKDPKNGPYLEKVQELNLGRSDIKHIVVEIKKFNKIKKLDLSSNGLTFLPPSIGELKELEELDLRNNDLDELPEEIGQLERLRKLSLCSYGNYKTITKLPSTFKNLENLEELHMTSLDQDSWQYLVPLKKLKKLTIQTNCTLEEVLKYLPNLEEFDGVNFRKVELLVKEFKETARREHLERLLPWYAIARNSKLFP